MIDPDSALELLLGSVPAFADDWAKHLEYWGTDERSLCVDLAALVPFVAQHLDNAEQIRPVFAAIERLVAEGDRHVHESVATCFLESLMNRSSSDFDEGDVRRYLGPRSMEVVDGLDVTG